MDAPDIAEAPDFPPDAGVKARKQLTTAHNRLLKEQAPLVQLTDKHLVQAARKEFRKHAEQWGVVVRMQPMRKKGRKSPIYHTHVRLLKCNQERYRRWAAERVAAEAKPAVEVKRERRRRRSGERTRNASSASRERSNADGQTTSANAANERERAYS